MPNMSVVFPPSDFGPMHPKSMPKEMLQAVLMIIVSRLRSGRCAIWIPSIFTINKRARMFKTDSNRIQAASSPAIAVNFFVEETVFLLQGR